MTTTVYTPHLFARIPEGGGFDTRLPGTEGASAHIVATANETFLARCSVWWEGTPEGTGTIGHLSAADAGAASQALSRALGLLRENGCREALSPMNGNTWRSYRYATGGVENRPPFLMEPPAAPDLIEHLMAVGFEPCNAYVSYLQPRLRAGRSIDGLNAAYEDRGIRFASLAMDRFEPVLDDIYKLSVASFRNNPHYTDIDRDSFVGQYLAFKDRVIPELVTLAYRGEDCVAFMFALPDYAELHYKPKVETVIIKTVAVHPDLQGMGLSRAVYDGSLCAAKALGFKQAIEALIFRSNRSEQLCKGSQLLREYTLYNRQLTGGNS